MQILYCINYVDVKRNLNHFIPKQNKHHARHLFKRMRQENKERIIEYTMRLKEKFESCEFGDNREDRILKQLIQTIQDIKIITKVIQNNRL